MGIIWGQRMYGRVDRFAGSHVATRFFHFYYLPLIPLSSWLVLEEKEQGQFIGTQVPLQLRSVLLAWLRVASVIAGIGAISAVANALNPGAHWGIGELIGSIIYAAAALAFGLYAFARLGKLSAQEKAARVVYSDFAGRFVDVALLGDGRGAVKQRATEELDRHLVKHATASYRDAPQTSWRQIATRPDVRDVPLLRAALTRCRVEWSEASGEDRRTLEVDHATILSNLQAAHPEIMQLDQFELRG